VLSPRNTPPLTPPPSLRRERNGSSIPLEEPESRHVAFRLGTGLGFRTEMGDDSIGDGRRTPSPSPLEGDVEQSHPSDLLVS
jgi:hypothetical protein